MTESIRATVSMRPLGFTNPGTVLYPETGTTKADILHYYTQVAPILIAHASWRPATVKRWVDGVGTTAEPEGGFFQTNAAPAAPPWIKRVTVEHSDHVNEYPLVNDRPTLAWLSQLAALEIHTPQWRLGSRGARLKPDRLIIDLDPGEGVNLAQCATVAILIRGRLLELGLDPIPVTSGSKGIHLYAAVDGSRSSHALSKVARELARAMVADHGDLVVSSMANSLRAGKVLIDWTQNDGSKTTIAPYSLRGTPRPTVAAPRTWREIASPALRNLEYTDILARVRSGFVDPLQRP